MEDIFKAAKLIRRYCQDTTCKECELSYDGCVLDERLPHRWDIESVEEVYNEKEYKNYLKDMEE